MGQDGRYAELGTRLTVNRAVDLVCVLIHASSTRRPSIGRRHISKYATSRPSNMDGSFSVMLSLRGEDEDESSELVRRCGDVDCRVCALADGPRFRTRVRSSGRVATAASRHRATATADVWRNGDRVLWPRDQPV